MKISLITVCYNSSKTIEETLKSVLEQTYDNYEYIIVDGLSKDNTLEIIKKFEDKFNGKLKYISEKDKGLYDAMNKGILLAKGDIVGILNSDDILANKHVFEKIISKFDKDIDGIYSDLVFLDESTMSIPTRNFIAGKSSKKLGWHPPHPTLYLRKEVYNKIGVFDLNYRIAADYDFMLRMLNKKVNLLYIKEYLIKMRSGGVSTNGLKGYIKNLEEAHNVLKKNNIKFKLLSSFLRIIKTFKQGISAKISKTKILKKLNTY
ncbi:MAG: glycosyltransferase family 2 protein [Bacilli bacterium]|nr:glycosyltransferase family 2 protein [Bacilli bacterium]